MGSGGGLKRHLGARSLHARKELFEGNLELISQ